MYLVELSIQDNGTGIFWKLLELEMMNLERNLAGRLLSYAFSGSVKHTWETPPHLAGTLPVPLYNAALPGEDLSELLTALCFCQISLNQEAGHFL